MSTPVAPPRPSLRIIHLSGGLRAFDIGDADVRVGPDYGLHLLQFPTQPYARTYAVLQDIGLEILGVDFISHRSALVAGEPPDFQVFWPQAGFAEMACERAWSQVRHVPEQRGPEIVDIAGRFATYLRLLNLRVRELSDAYRNCLRSKLIDLDGSYKRPQDRTLFANGYLVHMEAAIHAFLADAAGLRDLIAEAIWRLVLKEASQDVTTLASLLRRTRSRSNAAPLLTEIHAAGADGGWLRALTDLRNAITHVAPLANSHELHSTQVRLRPLRGGSAPIVHYPLTTAEGGLRPRPSPVDFEQEAILKERLEEYRGFVDTSGDALTYAHG